ncbi:MAG: hypothetical protein NVSMB65_05050 [Chloroflexota bacterium]
MKTPCVPGVAGLVVRRKEVIRHCALLVLAAVLILGLGTAGLARATAPRQAAMAAGAGVWEVTSGLGDDGAVVNAFLPETLHIYVGDTVRWHNEGQIEAHTITFGPDATIKKLHAQFVVPVPQRAGPPLLALNPQMVTPTGQKTYNGTGFVNSGLIHKGQRYSLTFTAAGTYHYYCLPHYPAMQGTVVVAPRPATPPFVVEAGYSDLGGGPKAQQQFYDLNFAPLELTIHAGDTVTWRLRTPAPHTVSVGPKAMLTGIVAHSAVPVTGADGQRYISLNPKIVAPAGGPTYDGTGFASSGLLRPRPGQTTTYKLTFTRPGDYYYACLLHLGMDGTIHVLPAGQ